MGRNIRLILILVLICTLLLFGCSKASQPDPEPVTTNPPATQPPVTQPPVYALPESLYGPGDFVLEGDYLSCTAGNAVLGIDVSVHQGQIDWQKVADAGIQFVFVRLGYRGYETGLLHTDKRAVENLQGAREAGLLVGAYFYSQAVNVMEAQEEARYALDILGDFKLDLPLVYDWEYVSAAARTANVNKTTLTECTIAFCEAVKNAGFTPMIYFNANQAKRQLDMEKLERYAWWLAMYNLENEMLCKVDAWQYSYTGRVDGISTTVDMNLLFTDYGIGSVFGEME